jgi:hypothetical protein
LQQRLRELRIKYRQLGPRVQVTVAPQDEENQLLGNELSRLLASSYLAFSATASEATLEPTEVQAGMVVSGTQGYRPFILDMLRALAPYLSGAVLVRYDQGMSSGQLTLSIKGSPRFYPNGAVQLPPADTTAVPYESEIGSS